MIPDTLVTGRHVAVASADVTGKRVVRCSGVDSDGRPTIAHATDKDNATITTPHFPVGIAAGDIASGEVGEYLCGYGSRLIATAGAAVTAGRVVTFDSAGKVIDIAEVGGQYTTTVGVALAAAAADGDDIPILFAPSFASKPAA